MTQQKHTPASAPRAADHGPQSTNHDSRSTNHDSRNAIDVHTHVFPDELAERAMAAISAETPAFPPFSDGTRVGLLAQMDAAGVGRAVAGLIATKPSQMASIFRFSALLRDATRPHPNIHLAVRDSTVGDSAIGDSAICDSANGPRPANDLTAGARIIPFPSIHPAAEDAREWIAKAAAEFVGIKLHPQYQDFQLDEQRVIELLRAARDAGLIVLMHAGQDPAYPGDMRARPENMARLLDAAPGVRMIAAHFGGWRDWPEALRCLAGRENLWLDTCCSLNWLPKDLAREIIDKHGAERIVFGSDSPWQSIAEERARVEALGYPGEITRLILRDNAARLLGLADAELAK